MGRPEPATLQPVRIADDVVLRRHAEALADLIEGEVRFGLHDRMLYATDASIYQVEPLGVVIPAGVEDVERIVGYCRDHRLPLLPRGGGTSLAGQCTSSAVVMDLSPTLTLLEGVDATARSCTVQPGITIDDLNDRLRAEGHALFFAPDPATARHCNVGGAIGNNAAGTRSILYGRTSENLLGVRAVLSTGETVDLAEGSCLCDPVARRLGEEVVRICDAHAPLIRQRFPRTVRRNAGYALDMMLDDIEGARAEGVDPLARLNLAHLVCGSEGTLAVVTRATLKLHPTPRAKGLAVIGLSSVDAAIACVPAILGLRPSAVELLDDMVIGLARENIEYRAYVELMPPPAEGLLAAVLYVEFFSNEGAWEIAECFARLRELMGSLSDNFGFAAYTDPSSMTAALKLRKAGEPLLHAIPGRRKPLGFVEDNAVPVERLAEFVRRFRAIIESRGTRAAFWAHASVGVLHVRPLLDMRDAGDRARMEEIAVEVADLAREMGGVMSGEHGDGRVRGPLLERHFGPELMGAFRAVKRAFDPPGLLNPGNIVTPGPVASIHEATRVRPAGFDVHAAAVETYFDYEAEKGFDHAVELCNGSGVCRKKQGGTMCPSYMGTLDERHSTRGRGNALRLAITGQLSGEFGATGAPPLWNDPETLETLNLCLSCKACKSECPSNVDIAKYKAEYLAQSYRATDTIPLKAQAFGRVRLLNRIGSAFAPLSNWVANHPLHRALIDPILGLDKRRTLPAFATSLFRRTRRDRDGSVRPGGGGGGAGREGPGPDAPCVILYADCFTVYNDPHIGEASIALLRALGYRVLLPDAGCCGRAPISTGLLAEAQRCAERGTSVLEDLMKRSGALAVLVCEPSCLSSIKDDWQTLRRPADRASDAPGESVRARRAALASKSMLVEDFLERHWDDHPRAPRFRQPTGAVVLHAHCHQKALWGAETSARLLRRIAGDRVRVLDSGCCGMAGSFGYTADRYDLSMKLGERALFPAVRAMGEADVLITPGTSCRHQVHDGTSRRGLHPVEYALSMLER
ncbi:MAG: FAD-linked oxidase C-terminal domain-containing protein [Planctomycetota bacterium]|nr:FAD-linked oxidase C-terminal domain-containing protein [Planctomycetota bacterium]